MTLYIIEIDSKLEQSTKKNPNQNQNVPKREHVVEQKPKQDDEEEEIIIIRVSSSVVFVVTARHRLQHSG